MRASILIKPASGLCNLDCKYCFYHEEMNNRLIQSYGLMKDDTYKNLLDKFLNESNIESLSIAFQGGEPTLWGLKNFKSFINYLKKVNNKSVPVLLSIQTNGILLNEEWAKFFKDYNFLVGVSLDGIKEIHDENRYFSNGKKSFSIVINNINLLKKYNVDFNILTVVTNDLCEHIEDIFNFYMKNNFNFQQYIPCIMPLGMKDEKTLSNEKYFLFLKKLFNLYYLKMIKGQYVYIRYFENILLIICKMNAESCDMQGFCSPQYVIEANGNVYPCDFYCLDEYLLGNINIHSLKEINSTNIRKQFLEKIALKFKCSSCKYEPICHGGCKRNKIDNVSIHCQAISSFLEYALPKFEELASLAINGFYSKT